MIRLFLVATTIIWLPYGFYCIYDPSYLSGAAGIQFNNVTGRVELQAMYGGLQAALGAMALIGIFRVSMQRPALMALAFLCAGLFSTRLASALKVDDFSSYTVMALAIECLSCLFAALLLIVKKPV